MYQAELLSIDSVSAAEREISKIDVCAECVRIMRDKAVLRVVKLHGVRSAVANILKQEMLSLGGDATVSQFTVNCARPKTDVLLMGTLKHYKHVIVKMRQQGAARPSADKRDEYKAVADELTLLLKKDLA